MARAARRKTIYDVATAVDASASTVSLVLNGSWSRYRIAEDTARRVTEAAERLGYDPNLAARGLRLSRSGLAGMVLPHDRNRSSPTSWRPSRPRRGAGTCAPSW